MGADWIGVGAILRAGEVRGVRSGVGRGVGTVKGRESARGRSLLGSWRVGSDGAGKKSALLSEQVSRDEGEKSDLGDGKAKSDESVEAGVARAEFSCLGKGNSRSTSSMPTTSGGLSLRFRPQKLKLLEFFDVECGNGW